MAEEEHKRVSVKDLVKKYDAHTHEPAHKAGKIEIIPSSVPVHQMIKTWEQRIKALGDMIAKHLEDVALRGKNRFTQKTKAELLQDRAALIAEVSKALQMVYLTKVEVDPASIQSAIKWTGPARLMYTNGKISPTQQYNEVEVISGMMMQPEVSPFMFRLEDFALMIPEGAPAEQKQLLEGKSEEVQRYVGYIQNKERQDQAGAPPDAGMFNRSKSLRRKRTISDQVIEMRLKELPQDIYKHMAEVSLNKMRMTKRNKAELRNDKALLLKECANALRMIYHTAEVQLNPASLEITKMTGLVRILYPNGKISEQQQFQDVEVVKTEALRGTKIKDHILRLDDLVVVIPENAPKDQVTILEDCGEGLSLMVDQIWRRQRDQGYNPTEQSYDLVDKDELKGKTVLVYHSISVINLDGPFFVDYNQQWLEEKGFKVSMVTNSADFIASVDAQRPDCVWVISGIYSPAKALVDKMIEIYNKGTGLFLWCDNSPAFKDANDILSRIISPKFQLEGNYPGDLTLMAADYLNVGCFDKNHPVSTGFVYLWEGHTVCYPSEWDHKMRVFAYNSNPLAWQPVIMYREPTGSEGYLWIDTGFTKLRKGYTEDQNPEEIRRYVTNATAYLVAGKRFNFN